MTNPNRLPRVSLVHAPTPLVKRPSLDALLGIDLWLKCDDASAGAMAGNKARKLEYLIADALAEGADTVLTCGALQSNHARATAIACAAFGLRCVLLLRVRGPSAGDGRTAALGSELPVSGNVLLDRLVGAEIRLISPALYADRSAVMETAAAALRLDGRRPYVIPEGGSNGLGALGYADAMGELRAQLDAGLAGNHASFDCIVHACGSGGTAAGIALGAAKHGVARALRAMAVCDDAAYFTRTIDRIAREARAHDTSLRELCPYVVDDGARGPAYGMMSDEQKRFLVEVARCSGVVLDPVYTGKALFGLAKAVARGEIARGARVLFVHTGGLPGALAEGAELEGSL